MTLDELRAKHIRTLDQGGTTKTEAFVDAILEKVVPNLPVKASDRAPPKAAGI